MNDTPVLDLKKDYYTMAIPSADLCARAKTSDAEFALQNILERQTVFSIWVCKRGCLPPLDRANIGLG